jgi:UDP-glucose 4-epimerase
LVEELSKNNNVTVLSREPKPSIVNPSVSWKVGSFTDKSFIAEHVKGAEGIIHLASLGLAQAEADPEQDFEVSVLGTRRILEAIRTEKVKKFVYASSAQVYGGGQRQPQNEDDVCFPSSIYAIDKHLAEELIRTYSNKYQINYAILRLFNVYGEDLGGRPRPTVETVFLKQLLAGEEPHINNPKDGRDFVHVSDVVNALHLALFSEKSGTYNVGTGRLTTMSELADILAKLVKSPIKAKQILSDKNPVQFQADTMRSTQELGFTAKLALETGLNQLVRRQTIEKVDK